MEHSLASTQPAACREDAAFNRPDSGTVADEDELPACPSLGHFLQSAAEEMFMNLKPEYTVSAELSDVLTLSVSIPATDDGDEMTSPACTVHGGLRGDAFDGSVGQQGAMQQVEDIRQSNDALQKQAGLRVATTSPTRTQVSAVAPDGVSNAVHAAPPMSSVDGADIYASILSAPALIAAYKALSASAIKCWTRREDYIVELKAEAEEGLRELEEQQQVSSALVEYAMSLGGNPDSVIKQIRESQLQRRHYQDT